MKTGNGIVAFLHRDVAVQDPDRPYAHFLGVCGVSFPTEGEAVASLEEAREMRLKYLTKCIEDLQEDYRDIASASNTISYEPWV
jgi:hypothetical protein